MTHLSSPYRLIEWQLRSVSTPRAGYVIIRSISRSRANPATDWPAINLSLLSMLGSFMSFFVVFYASQSYTRFNEQYSACMACEGRCIDIATLARSCMPRAWGMRLVRHVNAAQALGYTGLHSAYDAENFFLPFNEQHALVTPAELERLQEIGLYNGGGCYREAIAWAVEASAPNPWTRPLQVAASPHTPGFQ